MLRQLLYVKEALEQKQRDIQATIEPELNEISINLKKINEQIEATINPIASLNRQTLNKETGTIDFVYDGVKIKHDVPKRVEWDQKQLTDIAKRISEAGSDPAEYLTTTLKVKETNYKSWPSFIRETFEPARTVKYGTPKVSFEIVEKDSLFAAVGGE